MVAALLSVAGGTVSSTWLVLLRAVVPKGSTNPGIRVLTHPGQHYTVYIMSLAETSTPKRRLRRKLSQTGLREEIMHAAAELFAAEGYASVSMRKIARRIGYTPMSIYLHFADKDDLLDCVCERAFVDLYRRHEQVDADSGDASERLKGGMRTFIDFALQNPSYYRATFIRRGEVMPRRDRIRTRTIALKREQVAAFLGPSASVDEIEAATQVVIAAENGVATLLTANSKLEPKKMIEAVIETVIRGLRT
jgi:AcrR family transcriptional regulator